MTSIGNVFTQAWLQNHAIWLHVVYRSVQGTHNPTSHSNTFAILHYIWLHIGHPICIHTYIYCKDTIEEDTQKSGRYTKEENKYLAFLGYVFVSVTVMYLARTKRMADSSPFRHHLRCAVGWNTLHKYLLSKRVDATHCTMGQFCFANIAQRICKYCTKISSMLYLWELWTQIEKNISYAIRNT